MNNGFSFRWVAVAVLVVAILLVPALWTRGRVPRVRVAEVHRAPLVIQVSTNGVVEPIDDREVRARLDGRVIEIVDPGTVLRNGEVMVRLDEGSVASELEAARSERLTALDALRTARASLDLARRRFAADSHLHAEGALTSEHWRESRAAFQEAQARVAFLQGEVPVRVAALELRIRELEEQKDGAVVTAPFGGTVYSTSVRRGETVRAGALLLRFADLSRLRVRTNVDQVDLGTVREGQRAIVLSNAYPGREWVARIDEITPHVVLKENRLVAEALAGVTSPVDGLVPGMTVDVEIVVQESDDVLQVPAEAVFDEGPGPFVFAVREGKVRRAPIRVGARSATAVEVIAGVEAGERVVAGPPGGIQEGMRVKAQGNDGEGS